MKEESTTNSKEVIVSSFKKSYDSPSVKLNFKASNDYDSNESLGIISSFKRTEDLHLLSPSNDKLLFPIKEYEPYFVLKPNEILNEHTRKKYSLNLISIFSFEISI